MSKLTRKDVLHVAKLAKLTLSEAEISKFLPQLSKILEYVKKLNIESDYIIVTIGAGDVYKVGYKLIK